MRIENVDWQITSHCNRTCPYCFGPAGINDLPVSDIKSIVDTLARIGVKQIGITGGEPLLYPNIAEVIEYICDKDNKVWVKKSSLYYQGIINQIDDALADNKVPSECFLQQIDTENATNDLIQQIFILAQYSNYKREKLEESICYIIATTVLGIVSVLVLVLT